MRSLFERSAVQWLIDRLLPDPAYCCACNIESILGEDGLCEDCRKKLWVHPGRQAEPPLDDLSVSMYYSRPIRLPILRLKYDCDLYTARYLAQFARIPPEWRADLIVPVPIHPITRALRSFNHTALIAAVVSDATGIPFAPNALRKVRFTLPQKRLTHRARVKNLRNAYRADSLVKGLRMVVLDDVCATGTTLSECARALKNAGAEKVYGCAIASDAR